MQIIETGRADLESLYGSALSSDEMRTYKKDRLARLTAELQAAVYESGIDAPPWLSDDLNNARLASMSLYHGRLAEFRALLSNCNDDIACFYEQARRLSEQP